MPTALRSAVAAVPAVAAPAGETLPVRARGALRLITCGSVDDGKSTLIGRLLHEAQGILDDQLATVTRDSRRFGTTGEDVDFALLLDGLEAEREQGITIDVAYRFFSTGRRAFVVADTPGHAQYTRNMATGASTSDLAVLLVDARKGLLEQTRRHAAIVSLLGIRHVVLAINKMDLVGWSQLRFAELVAGFRDFAAPLGFRVVTPIPLSARFGDNVVRPSANAPWFDGPTLLDHLETIPIADETEADLRFPVQWVSRPNADFRGAAGTVASGRIAVGDPLVVAASGRTTRVARIVTMDGDRDVASAGDAVTLTFTDEIDIGRGDVLVPPRARPTVTRRFAADLVWMTDEEIEAGHNYRLKIGTATVAATITRIADRLDLASLDRVPADRLALNAIGRVHVETAVPVAIDPYAENRSTGAFILIDRATHATAAAGLVAGPLGAARDVHVHAGAVQPSLRAFVKAQRPLAVWLTGLPGSGKSTIADLVERRLVALGHHTMLLDGDNVRQGLNVDLGFDAASRAENVRRVGEVAKLMTDAGLIVLVSLVSPFRADRDKVAALFGPDRFLEVFVDASPETCRLRDPKGLYAKADAGRIVNFTGRDQPYEPPLAPGLVLPTDEIAPEIAAERLVQAILDRVRPQPTSALDGAQL
ncbi:adenylyl-sulfate kinase [Rhodoplanes elegans]|uniref:Multifunctional fusion protein n=1 Tax=Rhodoplanes elegans TaxID=29408 RepID=A0A327KTD0_9BRAD|nr:sulfate adenylyltransferase subunit CysN [Rhodoplanes elegans]MBK5961541.1 adenylyl-sulfate kinase [Rhodoplanes elegans]RAI41611.1 adenylyl-sulfate kinase [Rhodoplanes elegans]